MPTSLRGLRISKVDFVDKGAAIGARITLFKRREPQQTTQVEKTEGADMTLQEVLEALPEEQRTVVEAAMAELAAKNAEPAMKADEPKPEEKEEKEEKEEDVLKSLPASLRKQLDADRQAVVIAKKQADEARQEVAKMRDAELDRECVAKAAKLAHGALGLETKDLAAIFKSVSKGEALSTDLAKKLDQHFGAVEAALKKSDLFKEFGRAGDGEASPQSQLESVSKALREKDPSLTDIAATMKAYELRPELYSQLRNR